MTKLDLANFALDPNAPPSQVPPNVISEMLAFASRSQDGCFVEVGVFQGGTAWYLGHLAKIQHRDIYLYDTFAGIPHALPIDSHKVGDFSECSREQVVASLPHVDPDKIIAGLFPDSIVAMPKIAFAHIDCDQYQSIHDTVRALKPLMAPGGIMWFDDAPCLPSAALAVHEAFPGDRCQLSSTGKYFVRFF